MPRTYSQLPKASYGVLVGSIYAGLIMLFHLISFLSPGHSAFLRCPLICPVCLGRHTEALPKAYMPFQLNLGGGMLSPVAEIESLLMAKRVSIWCSMFLRFRLQMERPKVERVRKGFPGP